MPTIELRNVWKRYGEHTAVAGANIRISDGEYVTLLGPSGCGKTTLLRMIAGLTEPSEGEILINGKPVTRIPPEDRNIGYLFQNYALFPHMNVAENVGYGLLVRGDFKAEIDKTTDEMLRMVRLLEWGGYMPNQLSGGMRQRIALIRSLAGGSKILFLDEPMSSLDPKIGIKLRYELKKTARSLGLTVIHVTHDQADAMSISDRIIVMARGRIAQVGRPKEIYYKPDTPYVAHFIGESNFIRAQPAESDTLLVGGRPLKVAQDVAGKTDVVAAIRPEKILFSRRLENTFEGLVKDMKFLGPVTKFHIDVGGLAFTVSTAKQPGLKVGSKVSVYLPPQDIMVFDQIKDLESEIRIL